MGRRDSTEENFKVNHCPTAELTDRQSQPFGPGNIDPINELRELDKNRVMKLLRSGRVSSDNNYLYHSHKLRYKRGHLFLNLNQPSRKCMFLE